ncbi:MAG: hypothetical protein KR126chlam3_00512 [Chlamydiae bacterium]|nr:hypothetical protein [Chlamydiota bacterium]
MRWTLIILALALVGCQGEKQPEDIHFGPGPGDLEAEQPLDDCCT